MKKGWETRRLGDVCRIIMGQSPDGASYNTTGAGVPLVNGPVEFSEDAFGDTIRSKFTTEPTRYCKKHDLILCVRGSTTGRMNLAGFDACIGRGVAAIRAIDYQPWINYFIFSQRDAIYRKGTGATFPNVSSETLSSLPIPIPPLPEQQRIVGILDEAFAGLATAEANAARNLQNAREIFDSHLHAVFSQRGPCAVLSEFADEVTDGDHAPPPKASSGVPFITISNINKRTLTIDFSNTFAVPEAYFRDLKSNRKPRVGDVLYTVTGTLGIPILVRQQRDFCFQRHIGLIRPNATTDSSWLAYALRSPQVYRQATVRSTGAAQKTVSLGVLRSLQLPRFKLTEQKKMAAELDALGAETERLAALSERKIAALGELKKSLLHQAFAGGL